MKQPNGLRRIDEVKLCVHKPFADAILRANDGTLDALRERAAIMEYEAGMTREDAEREALKHA